MARPLRINYPGGWYHAMNRGINRQEIFSDDIDRNRFVELLSLLDENFRVQVHAYCLMANHYHLAVHTPEGNLSEAIRWLGQSYSQWFNRRHDRIGPLFQGRFKSLPVDPEDWLIQLGTYIHLNPVRVESLGLGKTANRNESIGVSDRPRVNEVSQRLKRLRMYRWSSYRSYAGYVSTPKWLRTDQILAQHGKEIKSQRARYRQCVQEQLKRGTEVSQFERFREEIALGSAAFVKKLQQRIKKSISRETEGRWRVPARIGLEAIIAAVEQVKDETKVKWVTRYGDNGKWIVLYIGRRYSGLTLKKLGEAMGGKDYSAVSGGIIRFEKKLKNDSKLRKQVAKIIEKCKVET